MTNFNGNKMLPKTRKAIVILERTVDKLSISDRIKQRLIFGANMYLLVEYKVTFDENHLTVISHVEARQGDVIKSYPDEVVFQMPIQDVQKIINESTTYEEAHNAVASQINAALTSEVNIEEYTDERIMQMAQTAMALYARYSYATPNPVSTEHIQQSLSEIRELELWEAIKPTLQALHKWVPQPNTMEEVEGSLNSASHFCFERMLEAIGRYTSKTDRQHSAEYGADIMAELVFYMEAALSLDL